MTETRYSKRSRSDSKTESVQPSTETLLARGWAETEDADPSYVWVTMRRLRQKVEVDPNHPVHLQTVRGVGYRLVAAADAGSPAGSTEPIAAGAETGQATGADDD